MWGQSALGLRTRGRCCSQRLQPALDSDASLQASGSSKSFLSSYMSEFPLGQEAALGTVGLYLNTCGEKSNIRVGTERV